MSDKETPTERSATDEEGVRPASPLELVVSGVGGLIALAIVLLFWRHYLVAGLTLLGPAFAFVLTVAWVLFLCMGLMWIEKRIKAYRWLHKLFEGVYIALGGTVMFQASLLVTLAFVGLGSDLAIEQIQTEPKKFFHEFLTVAAWVGYGLSVCLLCVWLMGDDDGKGKQARPGWLRTLRNIGLFVLTVAIGIGQYFGIAYLDEHASYLQYLWAVFAGLLVMTSISWGLTLSDMGGSASGGKKGKRRQKHAGKAQGKAKAKDG